MVRKTILPLLALMFLVIGHLIDEAQAFYEESLSRTGEGREMEILPGADTAPANPSTVTERLLPDAPNLPTGISKAPPTPGVSAATAGMTGRQGLEHFMEIGNGRAVTVNARGKDMPLALAVPLVLPKGWKVEMDRNIRSRQVTFAAQKKPWTNVLSDMSANAGTHITVDWQKGTVLVGPISARRSTLAQGHSPSKEVVRKAVISKPGRADEVARRFRLNVHDFCRWNQFGPGMRLPAGYEVYLEEPPAGTQVVANIPVARSLPSSGGFSSTGTVAVPSPAMPPASNQVSDPTSEHRMAPAQAVPSQIYALGIGPLSRQLAQWCNLAGYQMVWNADDDYDITSHSAFGGDFKSALSELFNSLMDAGHPLRATIYERNRIVEVTGE